MTSKLEQSEQLQALAQRADAAAEQARRLWEDNERWQSTVLEQIHRMFSIGTEFTKTRPIIHPNAIL